MTAGILWKSSSWYTCRTSMSKSEKVFQTNWGLGWTQGRPKQLGLSSMVGRQLDGLAEIAEIVGNAKEIPGGQQRHWKKTRRITGSFVDWSTFITSTDVYKGKVMSVPVGLWQMRRPSVDIMIMANLCSFKGNKASGPEESEDKDTCNC